MEPKERRCQSAKVQLEILFKFLNQSPRELSRHEEKLLEKETKAKETLKNSVSKEAVLGTSKATGSARTRKGEGQDSYKEDKRKGKRVVSTPRVVWKQKADKGGTKKTRSTKESSANPRGSKEVSGIRSKSIELGGVEKSLGTSETGSVFNRLENVEEEWGSKAKEVGAPHQFLNGWGNKQVHTRGSTSEKKSRSLSLPNVEE
ncbi:hypothetical protein F2Q68_00003644 [Brassica cretica]|uniref:Uncharacterized protein n=1 Tax=Brassica cretica TaxID=69181 RepID=A0A8S9J9A5_BRACR|nr:hypothetical protein F2Q68_00003644 [Brassica cretica]